MNRQWSKVKADLRALWAPSVSKRLDVHVTLYRPFHEDSGRVWVTWDGVVAYSFDDAKFWNRTYPLREQLMEVGEDVDAAWDRSIATAQAEGQTSVSRFYVSIEAFLRRPIAEALASPDPIARGFAMLDRRAGRGTLTSNSRDSEGHPFVRRMLDLRLAAEGWSPRSRDIPEH